METTANKNTATLLQLSALTQYFFPLGNFIFPALIWSLKKDDSKFVDYNGKQAVNFQLSLFLYSFLLIIIAASVFLYMLFSGMSASVKENGEWILEQLSLGNITWLVMTAVISCTLLAGLKIAEFLLILYASVKNSNGELYNFPITIKFIK